jgi:peptidoglycan/xylan/chitin deacetylase (PgdA/CDA1 family)
MMASAFTKRARLWGAWLLAATSLMSHAANVLYVGTAVDSSLAEQQTRTAADFYGLKENVILFRNLTQLPAIVKAARDYKTTALVLSAEALPSLDMPQILAALPRKDAGNVSLLIAGINEHTPAELLKRWSGGAITGCAVFSFVRGTGSYRFASVNGLTNELGGNTLPMSQADVRSLMLDGTRGEWIMAASTGGRSLPVFARVKIGTQEIFFATENGPVEMPSGADPYQQPRVFTSFAQQLIFLRYAGGERVWHSSGQYANLTIDDAWLREPYGFVNYRDLWKEMEQHNFHTTLAFVPWNYDRSEPAVVSLFQKHSDRFSICIHGNNHDHQEFGAYDDKPLSRQTNDAMQGLARMVKFEELTNISYDPVMVFPHSISPEQTFAILKRYNFWSTVNSLNVPMGAEAPSSLEFALRTATLAFATFPSLRRYSAEAPGPDSQLVVDAFLGNPMLFYVHHGFFALGIDAFSKTADRVNRLQPATQWRSLGYITKHLYLEKLGDDDNYDVRAYAGIIDLENVHLRDETFLVEKDEDFAFPITVSVDGRPFPYEKLGTRLRIKLSVRARASREITIRYQNDLKLATIDVAKTSMRINAIRRLSDFRDDVVSKTAFGQWFIRMYTPNETKWNEALLAVAILLISVTVAGFVRTGKKRSMMTES